MLLRGMAVLLCCLCCFYLLATRAQARSDSLEIYAIEVSGSSVLVVDPSGESLLIDTGSADFSVDRIVAAVKAAGIDHIDYVLITHYHSDHVGGVPGLVSRVKIGKFLDHGENIESTDATTLYDAYAKAVPASQRITVQPGYVIPFKGMRAEIVAASNEFITKPLPGAGKLNPDCDKEIRAPEGPGPENPRSIGVIITYGKFRTIDLGDLYKTGERRLVCPRNLIGTVDLLFPSDHGFQTGTSSAYAAALHPRAIVWNNAGRGPNPAPPRPAGAGNNGNANGGRAARAPDHSPPVWDVWQNAPGHPDVWQLHSALGPNGGNAPDDRIANLGETDTEGNFLEISAAKNGSFSIRNARTNYQKNY